MTITVREKEHWKERIEARIARRIDMLKATDPTRFDNIHDKAHNQALKSLRIADETARVEEIERERRLLQKESEKLVSQMHNFLYPGSNSYCYNKESEIDKAVTLRTTIHEEELLLKDKLGKQIAQLNREKENLLDTVWLATSTRQMKELWLSVASLLDEETTTLQSEAISINSHEKS